MDKIEEEKKQEIPKQEEGEPEKEAETTPLIRKAEETAERLEKANETQEKLLAKQEELMAKQTLGGTAEAGIRTPEQETMSDVEYSKRVLKGEENPLGIGE